MLIIFLYTPLLGFAAPHIGVNAAYMAYAIEPLSLTGYEFTLNYDPDRYKWRTFNVYFDAGFTHFWSPSAKCHGVNNIYTLSPVVRNTFKRRGSIVPYLELSIGIGYMTDSRFEKRNLGIHFTFQDRAGFGILIGKQEHFSLGMHALHYSNAHISTHNSGITVPVVIDMGYRF